jgi:hypothetical protein
LNCPEEDFHAALEYGLKKERIIREWRGIHIFSRALPENYFLCQLLAWMEMRKHKLWLEHWEETRIESARWLGDHAEIEFKYSDSGVMKVQCGVTEQPAKILLNGKEISWKTVRAGLIEITVAEAGTLNICFA